MRSRAWLPLGCFILIGCSAPGHAESSALTARGIVRASIETTISTELIAAVESLPFKVGEAFKTGSILVTFDCARYNAERRAAVAEKDTTRLEVVANEKLLRHNAIGGVEVEISRARYQQMVARVEALEVRERQCAIKAPFDGHVVERQIQPFEMSKPNTPLLKLVNHELEVHLIVPSQWLNWLRRGASFTFQIDETGATLRGDVTRISPVVDPISRTVRVIGLFSSPHGLVIPGMSGAVLFTTPEG